MRCSRTIFRLPSKVWLALTFVLSHAACSPSGGDDSSSLEGGRPLSHAHRKSGETCFICDASKRDPDRLWCHEHARYEDRCWFCQPQLEDKARPYCKEHFLYEDECFLCHPELREDASDGRGQPVGGGSTTSERVVSRSSGASRDATDDQSEDATELYCREHRVMERECGICQPQLAARLEPGESLKVRLQSALSASKAGIEVASPRPSESRPGFTAFCEVRYDENRLARVTPFASGIVRRVLSDVGSEVEAGAPLVEIHSAEIAAAKSAFSAAVVDHRVKALARDRQERLLGKRLAAEREFQQAEAACELAELAVKSSRQTLVNFGLTESEIALVEKSQEASALFQIRAPFGGTLVERHAVVGEAVEPGFALFTLADLETVWLDLSMSAGRVAVVEKGLKVEARFGDLPGFVAEGTIDWVDASLDERTRMLKARAVVPNLERKLKVGLFGNAEVLLRDVDRALRLPRTALRKLEGRPYVFVKVEDDLYALRSVALGHGTARSIDVLRGVAPDEEVVVEGTFTVMSEFLKSRLGAGCVDE